MHEFHLISDLMKKIDGIAHQNGARRVAAVKVKIGALAHISADHFREHFVHAAKGTQAENARLEIECESDTSDPQAQEIILQSVDVEE